MGVLHRGEPPLNGQICQDSMCRMISMIHMGVIAMFFQVTGSLFFAFISCYESRYSDLELEHHVEAVWLS